MKYGFENGKILSAGVEYSVAYHCNLRCAGCSHMSPHVANHFPSLKSFEKDIDALKIVLHAKQIRLLGGEPLLNPDIVSFIQVAKRSKIADTVKVTTNGTLLHKMSRDFWNDVDLVEVTLYPEIILKAKVIQQLKEIALETDTKINFFENPIFRTTLVTRAHPKDWITNLIFKTCKVVHRDHCHMVHEGKLYKCAVPPFLPEYLLTMKQKTYDPTADAFDIHDSKDLYSDLKRFLTLDNSLEACRYCLGYLGKKQKHHFLKSEFLENPALQDISRRTHIDRLKLLEEIVKMLLPQFMRD